MARGWESKSVEEQIEAAEDRANQARAQKLNDQDVAAQKERESLELSRTRVMSDLASATNPRYREILQKSLDFLNEKLAKKAAAS
jgi:flagellar biosynthesis regulator FlaF